MENICWNAKSHTTFEIITSHNIFTEQYLKYIYFKLSILLFLLLYNCVFQEYNST